MCEWHCIDTVPDLTELFVLHPPIFYLHNVRVGYISESTDHRTKKVGKEREEIRR